jgi:hypothetical protein
MNELTQNAIVARRYLGRAAAGRLLAQERLRLGQVAQDQRHQHQRRQRPDHEHHPPAERRDHDDPEQRGEHGADVVAGHQHGRGAATLTAGGVLVDQRDRHRQHTAQPETGEEAQYPERPRVRRGRAQQREHREPDDGEQHGPAAADDVGDGADRDRPDHHADEPGDRDQRPGRRCEPPDPVTEHG